MERRAVLELLQRRLLEELDSETGKDTAAIAKELRAITKELDELAEPEVSSVDDLSKRRAARRAAASGQ